MKTTKYIWHKGKFIPWKKAGTHILTHSLHYGGAAFEGIRCYQTRSEAKCPCTAIFRLREHMKRFLYSMKALKMEHPWTLDQLCGAVLQTVRKNKLKQGYVRPLAYYGYGKMGLNPKGAPVEVIIACWPWAKYLASDALKVRISSYMRIHPKTTDIAAKLTGHYANSILASQEFQGKCDEVLLLDYKGAIAEGPGDDTILKGITRDTVMRLAKDLGYKVKEKTIKPKELFAADEAFLTGTAAEISPIATVDRKKIGNGKPGPVSMEIKKEYLALVKGKNKKYKKYLTYV